MEEIWAPQKRNISSGFVLCASGAKIKSLILIKPYVIKKKKRRHFDMDMSYGP